MENLLDREHFKIYKKVFENEQDLLTVLQSVFMTIKLNLLKL